MRCDSSSDKPSPLGALLGVCFLTHAACNAWLHSAGESFLASLSFRLSDRTENPPEMGEKAPAALFRATPSRLGLPPTSPEQPVNLEGSQSLRAPVFVRTSPPSVQLCLLPPGTAFPHPQWFNCRASTETHELRLTSAHLLWHSSARRRGAAWRT